MVMEKKTSRKGTKRCDAQAHELPMNHWPYFAILFYLFPGREVGEGTLL